MRSRSAGWLKTVLWAPLLLLAADAEALTRDDEALGFERTPPRLSLTDGSVSFFRSGAEDWTPAKVNTPLASGDLLFAAETSNFEVQIGSRAWVRGGEQTELGLTSLEPDFLQLRVTQGTVAFDLRSLTPGQTLELDTPNAAFKIEQAGYYRVAVSEEVTTFTSRRGGLASATVATGDTVGIAANEQLAVHGTLTPQLETLAAPELDPWDRWNYARSEVRNEAVSARYVPSDVYGVEDLDRYGDWRADPSYGSVWVPRGVAAGWAPYSNGSWLNDPYYGWTWVDAAPWGWAPFHYGRWVYTSGFWGWCPGPRVARAYYAPALVAFYGTPSASVGYVSYGAPTLGWVALGYGEPLYPWWGPTYFRSQPHWVGWGGSHHHGDWDDDHHGGGHGHGGHGSWHGGDGHGGNGHGGSGHGGGDHGGWNGGHDGNWGDHDDPHDGGGSHGHDWNRGDWDRGDGRKDRGDGHGGGGNDGDRWNRDQRNAYQNARVKGAIVSVDRDHFGRRSGSSDFRRAKSDELRPIRGEGSPLPEREARSTAPREARPEGRGADRPVAVAGRDRPGATRSAPPASRAEASSQDFRRNDARRERGRPPGARREESQRRNPPGFAGDGRVATLPHARPSDDASPRRDAARRLERPQPPQPQASRGDRNEQRRADRPSGPRVERSPEARVERARPPRAERQREARIERAPEARMERPREPRAVRAPEPRMERRPEPRIERSAPRETARAERSQRSAAPADSGRRSGGSDRGSRGGDDGGGRGNGGWGGGRDGGGRGSRH